MSVALRFEVEWRTTLFVLIFVPLLAGLGFWQLNRAEEKSAISREFETKRSQAASSLQELADKSPEELAYRPVQITGKFREQEYFLIDNRMVQGRYGNEVLAVFELENSGDIVLLNRGWIVADASRRSLPTASPVSGLVTVRGQVYVAPGKPYMLADKPLNDGWPKRIQAVQIGKLAAALGLDKDRFFPYPIRIEADQPGAYYVDWPVVNVSPAKHIGYAVQWFTMALVLALIYIFRSSNLGQILSRDKTEHQAND